MLPPLPVPAMSHVMEDTPVLPSGVRESFLDVVMKHRPEQNRAVGSVTSRHVRASKSSRNADGSSSSGSRPSSEEGGNVPPLAGPQLRGRSPGTLGPKSWPRVVLSTTGKTGIPGRLSSSGDMRIAGKIAKTPSPRTREAAHKAARQRLDPPVSDTPVPSVSRPASAQADAIGSPSGGPSGPPKTPVSFAKDVDLFEGVSLSLTDDERKAVEVVKRLRRDAVDRGFVPGTPTTTTTSIHSVEDKTIQGEISKAPLLQITGVSPGPAAETSLPLRSPSGQASTPAQVALRSGQADLATPASTIAYSPLTDSMRRSDKPPVRASAPQSKAPSLERRSRSPDEARGFGGGNVTKPASRGSSPTAAVATARVPECTLSAGPAAARSPSTATPVGYSSCGVPESDPMGMVHVVADALKPMIGAAIVQGCQDVLVGVTAQVQQLRSETKHDLLRIDQAFTMLASVEERSKNNRDDDLEFHERRAVLLNQGFQEMVSAVRDVKSESQRSSRVMEELRETMTRQAKEAQASQERLQHDFQQAQDRLQYGLSEASAAAQHAAKQTLSFEQRMATSDELHGQRMDAMAREMQALREMVASLAATSGHAVPLSSGSGAASSGKAAPGPVEVPSRPAAPPPPAAVADDGGDSGDDKRPTPQFYHLPTLDRQSRRRRSASTPAVPAAQPGFLGSSLSRTVMTPAQTVTVGGGGAGSSGGGADPPGGAGFGLPWGGFGPFGGLPGGSGPPGGDPSGGPPGGPDRDGPADSNDQ